MQEQKLLFDLFQAYYDARKNKRNTLNQLDFEFHLEENLIKLYEELISWNYTVWRSIYFIQNHPVKREIFAWDFRDRVIHHLIYNYISPVFEKDFIYDSYSCRKGKWTSFWVKRIQKFIRSCSNNYSEDCYILKLDVSWYFMSIDKDILFKKIKFFLHGKELNWAIEYNFLINLIEKIIYNDPTKNWVFKWKKDDYIGLPKNKSLFFARENCGLPIGNLTSQLFSNIYLNDFDKFIKYDLSPDSKESKLFYGRYVDDFVIIHKDKDYLKKIILEIDNYLKTNLRLTLHPKKIYLQHYTKWVLFLWVFIKPYRTYIRKRTIWYFYKKIISLNERWESGNFEIDSKLKQDFLSIINSYLWFLRHHKSYKKRKYLLLSKVKNFFWNYFYVSNKYLKVVKK